MDKLFKYLPNLYDNAMFVNPGFPLPAVLKTEFPEI